MDLAAKIPDFEFSTPIFLEQTIILAKQLKQLSTTDISKLMKISPKLAQLNWQRFQDFCQVFNLKNSKPALFLFNGDVYEAMKVQNYTKQDLQFAEQNLRILSGFYGILKPLDLIQPYRLEMGLNLKDKFNEIVGRNFSNLSQFWQQKITNFLNQELERRPEKVIINLASNEYFSAVDENKINGRIIHISFKEKLPEHKNLDNQQSHRVIGLFAKKARGLMANFIIKNQINQVEELKAFKDSNYSFQPNLSTHSDWCFCR